MKPLISSAIFFITTIIVTCISVIIVYSLRDRFPSPLSESEADAKNDFPGINAWDSLQLIAAKPHPAFSEENIQVHRYLLNQSSSIDGVEILWPSTISVPFKNSSLPQVIARIQGKTNSTLLVSAHFDSVPIAPGASDNGAGVAVALELLKLIAKGPQRHNSLLVFFNNGEELGLIGSRWLVSNTPFLENVGAFINLEGGGAGGKAILFRSSSTRLIQLYSKIAPYPHMNDVGGALIAALGSYTDYQTYTQRGIPGVDIAFYENRHKYHTVNDNLENLDPGNVQQLGSNTLAYSSALLDLQDLKELSSDSSSTFYDHMGISGIVLSSGVRLPTLVATELLSAVFLAFVYQRFFKSEYSPAAFLWLLLAHAKYYALAVPLCIIAALILGFPVYIFAISKHSSSVAFPFLGAFTAAALLAARWNSVYCNQGADRKDRELGLLVISGIVCGIHAFKATGNIFSLFSISNAPLVYLVTFSTISTLLTGILVVTAIIWLPSRVKENSVFEFLSYFFILSGVSIYPSLLVFDIATSIQRVGIGNPLILSFLSIFFVVSGCVMLPFMIRVGNTVMLATGAAVCWIAVLIYSLVI